MWSSKSTTTLVEIERDVTSKPPNLWIEAALADTEVAEHNFDDVNDARRIAHLFFFVSWGLREVCGPLKCAVLLALIC